MKRKVTDLEQKLINDGWCLAIKRYTVKHSEKTLCYEYHKTSDIRHNGKTYEQIIRLDQKRADIVNYGIANLVLEFMGDEELTFARFLFIELKHYVNRLLEKPNYQKSDVVVPSDEEMQEKLPPMTFEQLDELNAEKENK